MPKVGSVGFVIWIVTILAQPLLSAWFFRSGRARRWPSIFFYLCLKSLRSIALFGMYLADMPATYFYTYWGSAVIDNLICLWVISEVVRALVFPSARVVQIAHIVLLHFVVIAAVIGCYLSMQVHAAFTMEETLFVSALERATSLAWCIVFLLIAFGSELIGLRWIPQTLYIGLGFSIQSLGNLAWAWIVSLVGVSAVPYMDDIRGIIYLCVLMIWAYGTRDSNEVHVPSNFDKRLSRSLNLLLPQQTKKEL
jgi:hypothetical protein